MTITFKAAEFDDLEILINFAQEFNQEDHHPFDESVVRAGLVRLLNDDTAGRVWLICTNHEAVGYLVLTLGYRLAYGRYAFIDEIYVRPHDRGRGIGRQALAFAQTKCRELEVKALHLEVEQENIRARALYLAVGFVDYEHYFMTRWLEQTESWDVINPSEITFRPAQSADLETLVSLRQESGLADKLDSRARLEQLVTGDSLGRVWLIQPESRPVGYGVVTFSYSLEFHGRDALLDELYLPDNYRHMAVESLQFILAQGQLMGINALHVELERHNTSAQRLYRAVGFKDDNSYLMTKWISNKQETIRAM
jgi:ribosomal protein S18 acetylase RimI-like enzyme